MIKQGVYCKSPQLSLLKKVPVFFPRMRTLCMLKKLYLFNNGYVIRAKRLLFSKLQLASTYTDTDYS